MKRRFKTIISLMACSLLALILLQGVWISYAIKKEKSLFDQQVYDAVKVALLRVSKDKVLNFIDSSITLPEPDLNITLNIAHLAELEDLQELAFFDDLEKIEHELADIEEEDFERVKNEEETGRDHQHPIVGDSLTRLKKVFINTIDTHDQLLYVTDSLVLEQVNNSKREAHFEVEVEDNVVIITHRDSIFSIMEEEKVALLAQKEEVVKRKIEAFNEGIEQWVWEYRFEDNADYLYDKVQKFQDELGALLINRGIALPFDCQLLDEGDSALLLYSSIAGSELIPQQFKTDFSPDNFFTKELLLVLHFPDRNVHVHRKILLLIIGSILFTLIIVATFSATLYYIQRQKKLSEVKSDFINNMTHEFKTPIATIGLATDAIGSPKVIGDQERIRYYLNAIRQENKRMNSQVERVLQMAIIEQGKLQLDLHIASIHGVITNCINVLEMVLKKRGGVITTAFHATNCTIELDEVHIANVINNLLDNAIKYSEEHPEIHIETFNRAHSLFVSVSDKGLGMTKEVQQHIFDKFYRKPMGNIHNVKGFGLGLSYVKAVVEAHSGEISVASEPDRGSTFLLKFNCLK